VSIIVDDLTRYFFSNRCIRLVIWVLAASHIPL